MEITKDTKVCVSIAERPGNFGATIFNASFRALSLDFFYKPFKVVPEGLRGAIEGIRVFNIRGCGVSMPHKVNVLKYLDKIDITAKKIGAVNTIVNNGRVLSGYNTDFEGARKVLSEYYDVSDKKVLIAGAGGAARAVIMVLKRNKAGEIFVSNRDGKKGKRVADEFILRFIPFNKRDNFKGDLFINATSVGMASHAGQMIIRKSSIGRYEAVMDVVANPFKTALIKEAEKQGKIAIPGFKMALYQAAAQFKLYTGQDAPLEVMFKSMKKI